MSPHGTRSRYNEGCRCGRCRKAACTYIKEYRKTRKGEVPHGTVNGYVNWACRCGKCREAWRLK